ncbi:BLUF domain-containing protein [Hyphobacterium sp. HN65]|uniref:BLUF domain-containing protein n=1 Tax=Hyphobacterium lacteum TaxID=3116575 RepID=A0ABU7LRQ3_9PROT|nr:BLUF domain-containing protein [Hyphobacterium sp. HN65]MEE2526588.1 BLUF domain-containing protein [Hyphobacterium sp. HN65]
MRVFQLIYTSQPSEAFKQDFRAGLASILGSCRRHNAKSQITGALLFDEHHFIQLLEGDRQSVNEISSRIARDGRHRNTVIVSAEECEARSFPAWAMAFIDISQTPSPLLPHDIAGEASPASASSQSLKAFITTEIAKARRLEITGAKAA